MRPSFSKKFNYYEKCDQTQLAELGVSPLWLIAICGRALNAPLRPIQFTIPDWRFRKLRIRPSFIAVLGIQIYMPKKKRKNKKKNGKIQNFIIFTSVSSIVSKNSEKVSMSRKKIYTSEV